MRQLIEKILKLKTAAKVGVTVGLMLVVVGLYWQIFYSDLSDAVVAAQANVARMTEEKNGYEKRKTEYLAFRNELMQLQEEQRDLLKVLPKRAEIGGFLSNIQEQLELAGLEVISLNPEAEVPQDLYVRIPVRFEVRGGYHNLVKFFKSIGEIKRIVNVENISLTPDRNESSSAPTKMRARFMATTFRYSDQAAPKGDEQ